MGAYKIMDLKRIYDLLNIERECVMRGSKCNHNCLECELVQNDEELILMYNILIAMIGSLLPTWKTLEVNWDALKGNN